MVRQAKNKLLLFLYINSIYLKIHNLIHTSKTIEGAKQEFCVRLVTTNGGVVTLERGSCYVVQIHMWICPCELLIMDQTQNNITKTSSKDLLTCGGGKGTLCCYLA